MPHPTTRWLIALSGTGLQLCLGTVYAWSYFQDPLIRGYGWTNVQVTWAFSLAICFLGLAAALGGGLLARVGPRRLAIGGGLLFGLGYLLAALAIHLRSLPLLYLGYGVVGGIGLGLGYVTPVATVARWFPDKKGLATGMVIMGFGLGALLMSKVFAPQLLAAAERDLVLVFAWLGVGFALATTAVASVLRNPPPGYDPTGATAGLSSSIAGATAGLSSSAEQARVGKPPMAPSSCAEPSAVHSLTDPRFALMWTVFFSNILAGISLIGFQSQLLQGLWSRWETGLSAETLAAYGATLIAVSSLFNGLGRMFWGGVSDRLGRAATFRLMMASQIVAFAALAMVNNPWLFGGLVCYILLCYGGGFGTMPAWVLDTFGPRQMALVYGSILTAWSAAGIAGPMLLAFLRDNYADRLQLYASCLNAGMLAVGLVLAVVSRE